MQIYKQVRTHPIRNMTRSDVRQRRTNFTYVVGRVILPQRRVSFFQYPAEERDLQAFWHTYWYLASKYAVTFNAIAGLRMGLLQE